MRTAQWTNAVVTAAASATPIAAVGTTTFMVIYLRAYAPVDGSLGLGRVLTFLRLDATALGCGTAVVLLVQPAYRYMVRIGGGRVVGAVASCALSFLLLAPAALIEAALYHVLPLGWLILALPSAAFGLLGPPLAPFCASGRQSYGRSP